MAVLVTTIEAGDPQALRHEGWETKLGRLGDGLGAWLEAAARKKRTSTAVPVTVAMIC